LLTSKWLENVEEGSESALAELVTRACDKRDEEKAKAAAKGA
jgi:hypothetical protein